MENVILKASHNKSCTICLPGDGYMAGINVHSEIKQTGFWAKSESSLLVDVLRTFKPEDGTVIDVGSNVGYFTLLALSYSYKAIAFEANKIHKEYLDASIEKNGYDKDHVTYHEKFASDETEPVLFDGWTGNQDLIKLEPKLLSYVETMKLDDLDGEEPILFLKIDVEGAEPAVLRSAKNLFANKRVKYVMFELNYIVNNKIDIEQVSLLSMLRDYGFDLYEINDKLNKINSLPEHIKYWSNEYYNNHKRANPSITTGGTNIIAVLSGSYVPHIGMFDKVA